MVTIRRVKIATKQEIGGALCLIAGFTLPHFLDTPLSKPAVLLVIGLFVVGSFLVCPDRLWYPWVGGR